MDEDDSKTVRLHARVEAEILREIVDPPVALAPNSGAKFHWKEDKLQLRTVDGANVLMVDQTVTPAAFETYDVKPEGEELTLGLPCGKLENLVDAANDSQIIDLRYTEPDRMLHVRFGDVRYSLPGIDTTDIMEPSIPDLSHTTKAMVDSAIFVRAKRILGMAGSRITFEIGDGAAVISAKGDTDEGQITLETAEKGSEEDRAAVVFEEDNGAVSADFGINYIEYLPRFTPEGRVKASFDDDFPMLIQTNRAQNRIPTTIVLAPKIG